MTCWIAIPIKAPGACKTRLCSVLDDDERQRFVRAMLRHVISVAGNMGGDITRVLLAPTGYDLPSGFERRSDRGRGLNGELNGLLESAVAAGARRLVIVPADLPLIAEADIKALIDVQNDHALIAPDRAGLGTNALSLSLPTARDFRFQFGHGSFTNHCAEAARLSLPLTTLHSDRLAFDIDEPADLADFRTRNSTGDRPRDRHLETGGVVGSK